MLIEVPLLIREVKPEYMSGIDDEESVENCIINIDHIWVVHEHDVDHRYTEVVFDKEYHVVVAMPYHKFMEVLFGQENERID